MAFDPNQFLNAQFAGPLATTYEPPPAGEYPGQVTKVEIRQNKAKATGEVFTGLRIQWEIHDEEVRKLLESDHVYARQDFLLDVDTDAAGNVTGFSVGKNKNIALGRLFEACGINQEGASLNMLNGQFGKVRIEHRYGDDGTPYAEVKAVSAP